MPPTCPSGSTVDDLLSRLDLLSRAVNRIQRRGQPETDADGVIRLDPSRHLFPNISFDDHNTTINDSRASTSHGQNLSLKKLPQVTLQVFNGRRTPISFVSWWANFKELVHINYDLFNSLWQLNGQSFDIQNPIANVSNSNVQSLRDMELSTNHTDSERRRLKCYSAYMRRQVQDMEEWLKVMKSMHEKVRTDYDLERYDYLNGQYLYCLIGRLLDQKMDYEKHIKPKTEVTGAKYCYDSPKEQSSTRAKGNFPKKSTSRTSTWTRFSIMSPSSGNEPKRCLWIVTR